MINPQREEEEYQRYAQECAARDAEELERYKKAVEMCIVGGFLRKEKFEEALAFIRKFHN